MSSAPIQAGRSQAPALAVALARAGDAERDRDHLEATSDLLGPAVYLRLSIHPGLDTIRVHPAAWP